MCVCACVWVRSVKCAVGSSCPLYKQQHTTHGSIPIRQLPPSLRVHAGQADRRRRRAVGDPARDSVHDPVHPATRSRGRPRVPAAMPAGRRAATYQLIHRTSEVAGRGESGTTRRRSIYSAFGIWLVLKLCFSFPRAFETLLCGLGCAELHVGQRHSPTAILCPLTAS